MVGPRMIPPAISPTTEGCFRRRMIWPHRTATHSIVVSCRVSLTKSGELMSHQPVVKSGAALVAGGPRAGDSALFDQLAEMNQLGFRIMRRRNLYPYW